MRLALTLLALFALATGLKDELSSQTTVVSGDIEIQFCMS